MVKKFIKSEIQILKVFNILFTKLNISLAKTVNNKFQKIYYQKKDFL